MTYKKMRSGYLLVILAVLALALVVPAAAQATGKLAVQPGETVEVEAEPIVLDLINLRNASSFNPITELRQYRDDDPRKQVTWVIGVSNDGYFKINTHTLHGKYGRYFPYNSADGVVERNSIVFAQAQTPAPSPTETVTTVTETPTETSAAPTTAVPTQAPLPGLIAIVALGICGLLGARR